MRFVPEPASPVLGVGTTWKWKGPRNSDRGERWAGAMVLFMEIPRVWKRAPRTVCLFLLLRSRKTSVCFAPAVSSDISAVPVSGVMTTVCSATTYSAQTRVLPFWLLSASLLLSRYWNPNLNRSFRNREWTFVPFVSFFVVCERGTASTDTNDRSQVSDLPCAYTYTRRYGSLSTSRSTQSRYLNSILHLGIKLIVIMGQVRHRTTPVLPPPFPFPGQTY